MAVALLAVHRRLRELEAANAPTMARRRARGYVCDLALRLAPAIAHGAARRWRRDLHRARMQRAARVLHVLFVRVALVLAASEWECPAGSISGSHGVAACCPAACGHCGGRGCEERAGGHEACCAIDIQKAGRPCAGTAPPCVPQGRVGIGEVPIRTRRFRQNLIKDPLHTSWPLSVEAHNVSAADTMITNATSAICIVLHMCWRTRLVADYTHAAREWDRAARNHSALSVYFIDSCRNLSERHPFETEHVHRLPFQQRRPPLERFWLTGVEMDQVAAGLKHLPSRCTYVVKLTGKYFASALPSYLERLVSEAPVLALQARGPSWHGWSSELYVIARRFLVTQIRLRSSFARAEEWLDHARATVEALDVPVHRLPRFDLDRPVQRSGDFKMLTWL